MRGSLAILVLFASCVMGRPTAPSLIKRGVAAFYNPLNGGGSMLDNAGDGYGEPLEHVLTASGIINYARAIGFSTECFGIHIGNPQSANLGDGNRWVNQSDYGSASVGTCLGECDRWKSFPSATDHHNIVPDGYDIGRDSLVASAIGMTSYGGVTYSTVAESITGLLAPGSQGVNHGIAQDGIVALLTVTIT
ncbi:hypothetical protein F5887DRAFT_920582 [Amanita rubescens]|nr:hypothetical protein F5887DRAFT_920582 [Amanita rubescens]